MGYLATLCTHTHYTIGNKGHHARLDFVQSGFFAFFSKKILRIQSFTDVTGNHWAAGYITAATQAGFPSGYEDGTFRPENPITRAEAVKILNAMLGREASEKVLEDYSMPFTDVKTNHWAYYEILEASISHEHEA